MMTAKVRYDRFCYRGGNAVSLDSRMSGPGVFFLRPHQNGPLKSSNVSDECFRYLLTISHPSQCRTPPKPKIKVIIISKPNPRLL